MDRYAIFLDAGYFFAAGAHAATGQQKTPRKQISLKSPDKALASLCQAASAQAGMPLLRVYWYDAAAGSRPSLEQTTLAMLPGVKLRLGVLNNVGEQKGVDSLIVTDLIELARNKGISDAVIVSGDEDLRVAVQVVQSFGVRAHLLAVGDPKSNVSASLQMECDSVSSLPPQWFVEHLVITAASHAAAPGTVSVGSALRALTPSAPGTSGSTPLSVRAATASVPASLDEVARKVSDELLAAATPPQIAALKSHFTTANSVPPEFDRRLIAITASRVGGGQLTGDQTRHVRGIFVTSVRGKP
jgi:hypothetical protein